MMLMQSKYQQKVRENKFVYFKNSQKAVHALFHMAIKWTQLLDKRKSWNLKEVPEN